LNEVAPITKESPVKAKTESSRIEIVLTARAWVFATLLADMRANSRLRGDY
jgi:hypothetical protein